VVASGAMQTVVDQYLNSQAASSASFALAPPSATDNEPFAWAHDVRIENQQGAPLSEVPIGANWQVRVGFTVHRRTEGFVIALGVSTLLDLPVRTTWSDPRTLGPGRYEALFVNDGIHLADGQYRLVVGLSHQGRTIQYAPDTATVTISDVSDPVVGSRVLNTKSGMIINQMNVDINLLD
jgi:lipopolysaccharide transport system ATP-binding protein